MARVVRAGDATTKVTDGRGTRETTTTIAIMRPQGAVVHGAVRGTMDTPVCATVATILTTETTMSGEEIQAGAPALTRGINP